VLLVSTLSVSEAHIFNVSCNPEMFMELYESSCRILPENQSVIYENTTIELINIDNGMKGFIAEDLSIFYIPRGIEVYIKKLTILIIKNCGLRKVTKQNLEKFSELLYLDLSYNQIEILEHGLFQSNKYLTKIILNSNKIRVVEGNVFNILQNIDYLDFRNTDCYSGMQDKRHEIIFLVKQIETVCLNYNLKLWNHISNNNEKFDNLTKENTKMRKQIENLTTNLSKNISAIKTEDIRQIVNNEIKVLIIMTILITSGIFILIILALIIIFLKIKSINQQNLQLTKNKVQPYDTINKPTTSNDYRVSSIDLYKENNENFYQELPFDDISISDTQNNQEIEDTYSEVVIPIKPKNENEKAALYAVVNKK